MIRATSAAGLLLALTVAMATPVAAELEPWDQEKVTAAALELNEAVRAIQGALRQLPPPTLGQPGRHALHQLRDDINTLVSASRRMHDALSKGAGRDETFPTYRRMVQTARNASREIRRIGLDEPVPSLLERGAAALRTIQPFYDERPPL